VRCGIGSSLPWRERVRERGSKRHSPSPVSSPIKGEEKIRPMQIPYLGVFSL
jgi:hypothetical protein